MNGGWRLGADRWRQHRTAGFLGGSYLVAYSVCIFFASVFLVFIGSAFWSHLPKVDGAELFEVLSQTLLFLLQIQLVVVPVSLVLALLLVRSQWGATVSLAPLTSVMQAWRRCPHIILGVFVVVLTSGVSPSWGLAVVVAGLMIPHLVIGWRHNLNKTPENLVLGGHALGMTPWQVLWFLVLPLRWKAMGIYFLRVCLLSVGLVAPYVAWMSSSVSGVTHSGWLPTVIFKKIAMGGDTQSLVWVLMGILTLGSFSIVTVLDRSLGRQAVPVGGRRG